MRLPSGATKEEKQDDLFPWLQTILFFVVCIGVMIFLYPGKQIVSALQSPLHFTPVMTTYLRQTVANAPGIPPSVLPMLKDNLTAKERGALYQTLQPLVRKPETDLEWKKQWQLYQIIYWVVSNHTKDQPFQALLRKSMSILAAAPLTTAQLLALGNAALSVNQPALGLVFYERVIKKQPDQPINFLVRTANAALWSKHYKIAADYFFMAQKKATTRTKRRQYFLSALKSLVTGDLAPYALAAAEMHLGDLHDDYETNRYLADLAVLANKPDRAKYYIQKAFQLRNSQQGEP